MRAQTYKSGKPCYSEPKNSRSHGICPGGGSITTTVIDRQITSLIEAIELGFQWLEEVLSIISIKDEAESNNKLWLTLALRVCSGSVKVLTPPIQPVIRNIAATATNIKNFFNISSYHIRTLQFDIPLNRHTLKFGLSRQQPVMLLSSCSWGVSRLNSMLPFSMAL